MPLAEPETDRRSIQDGGILASRDKKSYFNVQARCNGKDLARLSASVANREAFQGNFGRAQQDNRRTYELIAAKTPSRRAWVARTSRSSTQRRVLEKYEGFVVRIEGPQAQIQLITKHGEQLSGTYPASELQARGVGEQDRFQLITVDFGGDVRFEIQRIGMRSLSPEQITVIESQVRHDLGGYTSDDDY